jgi:uncharacterized RDD family membrane protein YckC
MSATPDTAVVESSPAAPALPPPSAALGRRLAGMLYESLLLVGVLAVGFLLPHLLAGVMLRYSVGGRFLLAHVFLLLAGYFVWFWRHGGQTLAMQTWRIRLVRARDGLAPTLGQALLRYVLAWPSVLFYGVGLIWALFDRDRQFLHDRLAGTRLVRVA